VVTGDPNTVLSIGLHPSAVDYSRHPGLDPATLAARIEAGEAAIRAAGFDILSCPVPASPEDAEAALRECAAGHRFRVAMIGAGIRMAPEHTVLFERLVNAVTEIAPGVRLCFNTSPETTLDALRRWVQPALGTRGRRTDPREGPTGAAGPAPPAGRG
jgi:hypothetical protein